MLVRLKSGVLDVQGKAVENGIKSMGVEGVSGVRVGKLIELDLPGSDLAAVRPQIEILCERLLVNPIIETYEITHPDRRSAGHPSERGE